MMTFLDALKNQDASRMALVVAGANARPIALSLETAFDSKSRKKGLLGRSSLAQGHAMILAPCEAIHTFRMQFSIDVIFADAAGTVLSIRHNLAPWRMAMASKAFATIEMAAGEAARSSLQPGEVLAVRSALL